MILRFTALILLGLAIPLSFVGARYPEELLLQHVPTLLGLISLGIAITKLQISTLSFACVAGFLILHMVGARWIYSFVPYDVWCQSVFSTTLSEMFSWERNHYDRLVHFASGILGVPPAAELLQRYGSIRRVGAAMIAISIVLSIGAVYEIFEWLIAVTLSPEHAEAYNGQQGDVWDPQKDMALALMGAIIAAVFAARWTVGGGKG